VLKKLIRDLESQLSGIIVLETHNLKYLGHAGPGKTWLTFVYPFDILAAVVLN